MSGAFIIWGPETTVKKSSAIHPIVVDTFQSELKQWTSFALPKANKNNRFFERKQEIAKTLTLKLFTGAIILNKTVHP